MDRRSFLIIIVLSALVLIVPSFMAADTLPSAVTDDAFWRLIADYSEDSVHEFRFEYMSNEQEFQYVIPRLLENHKQGGGVYLGVGPEHGADDLVFFHEHPNGLGFVNADLFAAVAGILPKCALEVLRDANVVHD